MRSVVVGWAVGAALATGCATTQEVRPQQETPLAVQQQPQRDELMPAPAVQQVDPKAVAQRTVSAKECATEAKAYKQQSADLGWAVLKACVERGGFTRGNFTDLRLVLGTGWDEDLSRRPDSPLLLTRLVALRGGDVEGDLQSFQQARVPLFSLGAAQTQPDFYKGRYVVVRATLDQAKSEAGKPTAFLSEISLGAVKTEREVEGRRFNSKHSAQGSFNASGSSTRYGKGQVQGSYSASAGSKYYETEVKYENQMNPTGRKALGRLTQVDPFLEPGKDYVFLARFDGVRTQPHDEDEPAEQVAILTVVAYFRPSALLVD